MGEATPISLLLRTVFESILEVFLLCLAGWFLARKGLLDKRTQRQLNRINVSLFTPSLLFSKVAFFLSPSKLKELWIIPLFFVIVSMVSMVMADLMSRLLRLKGSQRNFAVAASMFMNSNSLPVALMQSLVITVPHLQWDEDDNAEAMLGRALTYLVLYSTLGMVLRWSYGVHLLARADSANLPLPPPIETSSPPIMNPELEVSPKLLNASPSSSVESISQSRGALGVGSLNRPSDFYSFPNTPVASRSRVHLPISSDNMGAETDDEEPLRFSAQWNARRSWMYSVTRRTRSIRQTPVWLACKRFIVKLNEFMTAPLWASLASIVVALTPPLQHQLEDHTQPLKGALQAAGACSIPLTLVVLGAYFYTPPEDLIKSDSDPSNSSPLPNTASSSTLVNVPAFRRPAGPQRQKSILAARNDAARPGETKTVLAAVVSRMILTPLILFPAFVLSAKYDFHAVFEDPVFVVSSVLLVSAPPAVTLAQLTQKAAAGDAFERLVSRTIFWAYCILTPPATIFYVVLGLWLSNL